MGARHACKNVLGDVSQGGVSLPIDRGGGQFGCGSASLFPYDCIKSQHFGFFDSDGDWITFERIELLRLGFEETVLDALVLLRSFSLWPNRR